MATYTIRLNELVNYFEGESNKTYSEKISDAAQKIINFTYPVYGGNDPQEQASIRANLNTTIVRQFLMREIGYETLELWRIMLETRLNLIMPKYQELYKTTLFSIDLENPYHLVTTHNQTGQDNRTISKTGNENQNMQGTTKEDVSSADTAKDVIADSTATSDKGTTTTTGSENQSGTRNTDTYHSDFPQVAISQDYASTEDKTTETTSSNGSSNQSVTANNTGTTTYTRDGDKTASYTGTTTGSDSRTQTRGYGEKIGDLNDNIMHYINDVKGRQNNMDILLAVEKWRDLIVNINQLIVNELNDLFMLIY